LRELRDGRWVREWESCWLGRVVAISPRPSRRLLLEHADLARRSGRSCAFVCHFQIGTRGLDGFTLLSTTITRFESLMSRRIVVVLIERRISIGCSVSDVGSSGNRGGCRGLHKGLRLGENVRHVEFISRRLDLGGIKLVSLLLIHLLL